MEKIEDKRYEIPEVFQLIGSAYLLRDNDQGQTKSDIVVDGFSVHPISLRYMTFYQKGTACVSCGKQGTHFRLCGDPNTNRRHFNLYADDGTLITKDHIIPKSKGGPDRVSNMQPMCASCNYEKGNQHPSIKIPYVIGKTEKGVELVFRDIKTAAKSIALQHIRKNKGVDQHVNAGINALLGIQCALEYGTQYDGITWRIEER